MNKTIIAFKELITLIIKQKKAYMWQLENNSSQNNWVGQKVYV